MTGPITALAPGLIAGSPAASVHLAPRRARFSLRARGDLAPLEKALGLPLPARIGARSAKADREALRLGPDEWVIHAAEADAAALAAACAAIYPDHPHSLVDISAREVTFALDGPAAADLVAMGCPRDLAAIALGTGRRTVFHEAAVVLWRDTETAFRLDIWLSFAPHLASLLSTGCRELSADAATS